MTVGRTKETRNRGRGVGKCKKIFDIKDQRKRVCAAKETKTKKICASNQRRKQNEL